MDWWIGDVPNVWLGVTVENQARAEERIPILLSIPAAVRFVSVEPMLGPVTLRKVRFPTGVIEDVIDTSVSEYAKPLIGKLNGIDWVIAGPETGPGARECRDEWIEALARESSCFFDKRQRGHWVRREFPNVPVRRAASASPPVAGSVVDSMCREKMGHGSNPHWCCLPKGHDGQHSCGLCALLWDTPNAAADLPAIAGKVRRDVGTLNQEK
jgi:hypothetical protein